ncbi:MAG: hypothetical protein U1D30_21300 [Planctomycetota bacterium]
MVNEPGQSNVTKHEPPTPSSRIQWKTQIIIALVLCALGVVGLGLMDFSPNYSEHYWYFALPVFVLTSIYLGWESAKRRGENPRIEMRRQIFHWLGFFFALNLILVFLHAGTIERNVAGPVSLVLLALTCYLAGIHFEPAFIIVGILLALAAATAAYLEEYLFIILVIAFLLLGVVLVQIRGSRRS